MLFLLRQLRRLDLRKRSGRYFLYAVGEIVLIILGIVIALQIQDWNQDRADRVAEKLFLQRIQDDLQRDLVNFAAEQEAGQEGLEALEKAIELLYQENTEEDFYTFNDYYDLAWLDALRPQYSTYLELESTGRLNLIRDDGLRLAILDHYAYYRQMEKAFDRLYEWHDPVTRYSDADTKILKYVNTARPIFKDEHRDPSDWAYINDPQHPHFHKTETAVAAISWWLNESLNLYEEMIPRVHALHDMIDDALQSFE